MSDWGWENLQRRYGQWSDATGWTKGVPHNHPEYVEGCFRCDLSRDEVMELLRPRPEGGEVPSWEEAWRMVQAVYFSTTNVRDHVLAASGCCRVCGAGPSAVVRTSCLAIGPTSETREEE